jgi:hypothetical protein
VNDNCGYQERGYQALCSSEFPSDYEYKCTQNEDEKAEWLVDERDEADENPKN